MTGSLQQKNGKYYAVLNTYENGKRKQKWIDSTLPIKGNKTRAEKFLREQITLYEKQEHIVSSDMSFSNYVRYWLTTVRNNVDDVTFQGYKLLAESQILPYFDNMNMPLQQVTHKILQKYFDEKAKNGRVDGKGGLSVRSLKLHKNVINQTLNEAVKNNLIPNNPCQWVKLPSMERREPSFYSAEQLERLLNKIHDEPLYLLVKITAFYGLRRSEVLGLQWNSIDFDKNLISIKHTVVKVNNVIKKDKTKNASSYRSFPLIPEIRESLLLERERQIENRKLFKKAYCDSPYIFVWDDGRPFSPDYVSHAFKKMLKRYNLPEIRFHDLRHSCASILLSKGFTLKDVQEWLGHADIKMTANVYGHLDMSRKNAIADGMAAVIQSVR